MPRMLVMNQLKDTDDTNLSQVAALAATFETSLEMTARRYIELNNCACAIVFSKDNRVRYSVRSVHFDLPLSVRKGDSLPAMSESRHATGTFFERREIDAHWWIKTPEVANTVTSLFEQTLRQDCGFKITLLTCQ